MRINHLLIDFENLQPELLEALDLEHYPKLAKTNNAAVWFMLHSGSRGVGNAIGAMFIELAKQDALRNNANLPLRMTRLDSRGHAAAQLTIARKRYLQRSLLSDILIVLA